MNVPFEIARLLLVLALVCVAAALATPKGRLPLALRGLAKLVNAVPSSPRRQAVSSGKRLLAFILILAAIALALI